MGKPDWSREGCDWPNRDQSRFVSAGGLRWHVQVMGAGRDVLLLHGAGAATHSWRDVAPLLARDYRVIVPDLPGHGFTQTPAAAGLSLDGMAAELDALMKALQVRPRLAVAHSAGAAIALRMRLDGRGLEDAIVSFNGALQPFPGAAGHIFPALARLLFLNPLTIHLFARRAAQPGAVAKLIESTGSRIDQRGLDCYARLMRASGHIDGALGMMAHWNLQPLQAELPRLTGALTLVAAGNDRAVPPRVAEEAAALAPQAKLVRWPGLGHLAHEEAPEEAARVVREAFGGP